MRKSIKLGSPEPNYTTQVSFECASESTKANFMEIQTTYRVQYLMLNSNHAVFVNRDARFVSNVQTSHALQKRVDWIRSFVQIIVLSKKRDKRLNGNMNCFVIQYFIEKNLD